MPKSEPSKRDAFADEEEDVYMMAKSYFDLKEYDRCAFFSKAGKSPRVVFLHYYSRCVWMRVNAVRFSVFADLDLDLSTLN